MINAQSKKPQEAASFPDGNKKKIYEDIIAKQSKQLQGLK